MIDINAVKCDIRTTHPPKAIHSQNDNAHWLIMCFQTPFVYEVNGMLRTGNIGDCIINPPGDKLMHGPTGAMDIGFQNDWIYISGEGVEEFINKHNIPINEAFSVGNPNFLTAAIQTIMYEKLNKDAGYEEKISAVVQGVLVDIARIVTKQKPVLAKYSEVFNEIRDKIFNSVEDEWPLQKMAESTGYSVSRFCYLYQKMFNVSPSADLLRMRIQKAKNMLSYTNISIGHVAENSGFSSDHHFSYAFKNMTGLTPSEYRAKNKLFSD